MQELTAMEHERFDRRTFLNKAKKVGLGVAGGLSLLELASLQTGIGVKDAINATKMGAEYGPEIALAVGMHPQRFKDTVDLWLPPEESYRSTNFFNETFEYSPHGGNVIVAFGDSNMVGADGRDRGSSPVVLFKEKVENKWNVDGWEDYNLAQSGYTTQMVIERQVRSYEAKQLFDQGPCDVWVNAGGNDMANVARTLSEVEEIQKLSRDPWASPDILLKYASRMMDKLSEFRRDFSDLLFALDDAYGSQIKHLVVMSVPDFSKAPAIISQEIDDRSYRIPLEDPYIRDLVGNISIRMNNEMFGATEDFQEKRGHRIIGIDTFPRSRFKNDQHFTREADEAIALDALNRVEFLAA